MLTPSHTPHELNTISDPTEAYRLDRASRMAYAIGRAEGTLQILLNNSTGELSASARRHIEAALSHLAEPFGETP